MRTLAYVAHRNDWLSDSAAWAAQTRVLEDKLSDMLHEQLMQRFVDRRTSALIRGLEQPSGATLGGVSSDGTVIVEGHRVGQLLGLQFRPEQGNSPLAARALRGVIDRAVAPEVSRRLAKIAEDDDEHFSLQPDRAILWHGHVVGEIVGGTPFSPVIHLDGELGAHAPRARAKQRLESYVKNVAGQAFSGLAQLKMHAEGDSLGGLARGLAYQLVEGAGTLARWEAEKTIDALYRSERKALRELGVRFGAFTIFHEDVVAPATLWIREIFAYLAAPNWQPSLGLSVLPNSLAKEAVSYRGLRKLNNFAVPLVYLERIGDHARRYSPQSFSLSKELLIEFNWNVADADRVLASLGFRPVSRSEPGTVAAWRRATASGGRASLEEKLSEAVTLVDSPKQSCRIDVWLWRARFCKTRALASKLVSGGEVSQSKRDEQFVIDKPSRRIRPGDKLTFVLAGKETALQVLALGERRGQKAEARALYALLSS